MREFKVGDEVKVVKHMNITKNPIGSIGIIDSIDDEDGAMYSLNIDKYYMYFADELELVTEPMTYRDALLHALNGTMTVRHTSMDAGTYLVFDGESMMDNLVRPRNADYINERTGSWEQYIVPTPPKFTIGSLVYNTHGSIGKIVEDKGIRDGERRYGVAFNAVKGVPKSVKESELTAYVL